MDQSEQVGGQSVIAEDWLDALCQYDIEVVYGDESSKIRATIKIAYLAHNLPVHILARLIPILADLLTTRFRNSSPSVHEAAAFCLKRIARRVDGDLPVIMSQSSAIPSLLKLLPNSHGGLQKVLIKCLRNIVLSADGNRTVLIWNGGLELVLDMFNACSDDTRQYLLELLSLVALSREGRRAVINLGGLSFLVESAKCGSIVSRTRAAHAIGLLGLVKRARRMVVDSGAIPVLIELLRDGDICTKLVAGNALGVISSHVDFIRPVAQAGAIPLFVELFESPQNMAKEIAHDVFSILSIDKHLAVKIAEEMVRILKEDCNGAKAAASRVMWDLCGHKNSSFTVRNSGAIPVLVALLRDESVFIRENVSGAISNLAYNGNERIALANAGAVPILHDLLGDESEEVRDNVADALLSFSEDPLLRDRVSEELRMPAFGNIRSTMIQIRDPNVHMVRSLREMSLDEVVTWDPNFV